MVAKRATGGPTRRAMHPLSAAQGRIVLGILLGRLGDQCLYLLAHPLDFLLHIAIAHRFVPRRVALELGAIGRHVPNFTSPDSPAIRSTFTNTSQKAARCSLRKSLMVRKSGRSFPTMAMNARFARTPGRSYGSKTPLRSRHTAAGTPSSSGQTVGAPRVSAS